jgi:hypothetical protein
MVDIPADGVSTDRARARIAKAWRTLAVLMLFGILSFAGVSDQSDERRECGPFTIGVSPLSGCDWLQ